MEKVDLHIHTNCSDGGLEVQQVFDMLKEENVKIASIADHCNYDAYMKGFNPNGVKVINGIECDVEVGEDVIHILMYDFDDRCDAFKNYLNLCKEHDIKTFKEMLEIIKNNYNLTILNEKVEEFIKNNGYFDIVRLNNFLTESGFSSSPKEAFYKYTNIIPDKRRYKIKDVDFFKMVKKCGGVSIVAHPMRNIKFYGTIERIKEVILELKSLGLDGVEVYNNRETNEDKENLLNFCRENDLLISGGSDFHKKLATVKDEKLGVALGKEILKENLTIFKKIKG